MDEITKVDNRIVDHVNNQVNADKLAKQMLVTQQTEAIYSHMRRYQALSEAQAAASRLQATLGLEPNIEAAANLSLPELINVVDQSLRSWSKGELPPLPMDTAGKQT
jgi:hypothetical protein